MKWPVSGKGPSKGGPPKPHCHGRRRLRSSQLAARSSQLAFGTDRNPADSWTPAPSTSASHRFTDGVRAPAGLLDGSLECRTPSLHPEGRRRASAEQKGPVANVRSVMLVGLGHASDCRERASRRDGTKKQVLQELCGRRSQDVRGLRERAEARADSRDDGGGWIWERGGTDSDCGCGCGVVVWCGVVWCGGVVV